MKTLYKIFFAVLAAVSLIACNGDVHKPVQPNEGKLAIGLLWQDQFETADEIKSVRLWLYNMESGTLVVDKSYAAVNELSLDLFTLRGGKYYIVVGVNVVEEIGESTLEDLVYELARQSTVYDECFYGELETEISSGVANVRMIDLHDKPHEDTFIEGEGDINDWEDGEDDNGEILNPREP